MLPVVPWQSSMSTLGPCGGAGTVTVLSGVVVDDACADCAPATGTTIKAAAATARANLRINVSRGSGDVRFVDYRRRVR